MSTAIAMRQESAVATAEARGFIVIETFEKAKEIAEYINKSALVPDAYRGKPADIVIAMQYGVELGLSPMQALQSVCIINGKPSIFGDAVPAIVIGLPECDDIIEVEPTGENPEQWVATCTVKRRGKEPKTRAFSWQDAKRAGLAGKKGPWQDYPKRMLLMRARGFAIRDAFPDRMKGMILAEEAMDYPPPAPEPSEPRRVGESATPAAAAAKATQASPARSDTTPVAPTDAAAPASPVPAPAEAATPAAASVSPSPDQVERGVKMLNTAVIVDDIGNLYEIETTRGVFYTRDKARWEEASSCEGTETALVITWRSAKRKKQGKLEPIKALVMLALDEGQTAPAGGAVAGA